MPTAWTKLIISHFSLLEMAILPFNFSMLNKEIHNAFLGKGNSPLVLNVFWFISAWKLVITMSSPYENLTWCNYLTPLSLFDHLNHLYSEQLSSAGIVQIVQFVQILKYSCHLHPPSFLQAISNYVIILCNFVRKSTYVEKIRLSFLFC